MRLARVRRLVFVVNYAAVLWASVLPGSLPLPRLCRLVGATGLFASLSLAAAVHRLFPERHEKPSDFPRLLTEGPYSVVRHPFYLCIILSDLFLALYSLSPWALVVTAALVPLWWAIIRLEERELLEWWGRDDEEYMKRVPALVPRPWRRTRGPTAGP